MRRHTTARLGLVSLLSVSLLGATVAGCGEAGPTPPVVPAEGHGHGGAGAGKADASAIATFLTFEFDGELVASDGFVFGGTGQLIDDQLLYTIGHLNGNSSVGRLDRVEITNVREERQEDGTRLIRYHARLPVAWGSRTNVPTSYEFTLPRDVTTEGKTAFTSKYKESCVDWAAHDVDEGSMWYYYRPKAYGCTLADEDVVRVTATATPSGTQTTGKYPEYHKVWEDNALRVVAIFGKYEDGATDNSDAGIASYNSFIAKARTELGRYPLTVTPDVTGTPGVANPDITFRADLGNGKTVEITALLVDNVRDGSPDYDFDARYNSLTGRADLIAYNGHAGLGQNVRALARKGHWESGQYMIFFSNGCDTYAYVDGFLAQTRARINRDDFAGTKYMDIVTNAMPAYFRSTPAATMAIINGLLAYDRPQTYEDMFRKIDSVQVVLVTGEEDNVFTPDAGTTEILKQSGSVVRGQEQQYTTRELEPGSYLVLLEGDGDADLYVRTAGPPTTQLWDCRPYIDGSAEECRVSVTQRGPLYVMVRGYGESSSYTVTVK